MRKYLLPFSYKIEDIACPLPEDEVGDFGPAHELRPFVPKRLDPDRLMNREICDISIGAGPNGMSNINFLAICLSDPREWLFVAIPWATRVLKLNGQRGSHDEWLAVREESIGARCAEFHLSGNKWEMKLSNGIWFSTDPDDFRDEDNAVENYIFLSPTEWLWSTATDRE